MEFAGFTKTVYFINAVGKRWKLFAGCNYEIVIRTLYQFCKFF